MVLFPNVLDEFAMFGSVFVFRANLLPFCCVLAFLVLPFSLSFGVLSACVLSKPINRDLAERARVRRFCLGARGLKGRSVEAGLVSGKHVSGSR